MRPYVRLRFYDREMKPSKGYERRWLPWGPEWWNGLLLKLGKVERKLNSDPQNSIDVAQRVLDRALRAHGPNARVTVFAMWELADRLEQVGRLTESLPLRQEVVDRLRIQLGDEHEQTLRTEM